MEWGIYGRLLMRWKGCGCGEGGECEEMGWGKRARRALLGDGTAKRSTAN